MIDLWPFEKRFEEIPCGREAGLAGLIGAPVIGGALYMYTARAVFSMRWGTNIGIALVLLTFAPCRFNFERKLAKARQIQSGIDFKDN